MKRFSDFISEEARALHVYDIDDTLVHPTAKIKVKNEKGEVVKTLDTHEYAKSSRTLASWLILSLGSPCTCLRGLWCLILIRR